MVILLIWCVISFFIGYCDAVKYVSNKNENVSDRGRGILIWCFLIFGMIPGGIIGGNSPWGDIMVFLYAPGTAVLMVALVVAGYIVRGITKSDVSTEKQPNESSGKTRSSAPETSSETFIPETPQPNVTTENESSGIIIKHPASKRGGYSHKGFFGEVIHYDANGKKIGESRKNFWGGYDHFDANGKKTGTSQKAFLGGMNHYDNSGKSTGHSQRGFWGQTNHYDNTGHKVGESTRNFFGGTNYYATGHSSAPTTSEDEHEAIQNELFDECLDEAEAAEWLEDNGYNPDDFDL